MKNICVVTGTRADYGLLYWTMKRISESPAFNLQLIVTGMHLEEKFGDTWKGIEKDGFKISIKIPLGNFDNTKHSLVTQVASGLTQFADFFEKHRPDLVIVLGDRYEILSAAHAAFFLDIPLAHIHGGEITEGAVDDTIRHLLTKLSTYHFTSTDAYSKRVIQMGEHPSRVLNVGAVGLEFISNLKLISREEIEERINFKFKNKNFLITYHPVTAASEDATQALIESLKNYPEIGQIITFPNGDPGYQPILDKLLAYERDRDNVLLVSSLGSENYISAMALCDVVVGNSSSGIVEAPFLGRPSVNIGTRQKGRIRAPSVIDVSSDSRAIDEGIQRALSETFTKSFIHGSGHSSELIIEFLKNTNFSPKVGFYDL
jgi:UDP-hydrolysing UDP-N-acetyl-D-glucosamine 2-epimerase